MTNVESFYPWGLSCRVKVAHLSKEFIIGTCQYDLAKARAGLESISERSDFFLLGNVSIVGLKTLEDAAEFQGRLLKAYHEVWVKPFKEFLDELATSISNSVPLSPELTNMLVIVGDEGGLNFPLQGQVIIDQLHIAMHERKEDRDRPGIIRLTHRPEDDHVHAIARELPELALADVSNMINDLRSPAH